MYNTIGMPEFYQEAKRKKLPIIDVREEMEYQLGHVPQAINLPKYFNRKLSSIR